MFALIRGDLHHHNVRHLYIFFSLSIIVVCVCIVIIYILSDNYAYIPPMRVYCK